LEKRIEELVATFQEGRNGSAFLKENKGKKEFRLIHGKKSGFTASVRKNDENIPILFKTSKI
jgi:hypothetical protein